MSAITPPAKIHQQKLSTWITLLMCTVAIILGAVHAWIAVTNYSMNEDGINYLDMGDAYMRGDWSMALNSVWSPVYSWILGLILRLLRPSMRWEFPVVQLVNLAIYLVALICFIFFWRQLTRYRQTKILEHSTNIQIALPVWAWVALGYSLFIWSSLTLIEVWAVTPDMLLAAFVYLAAGLVLRFRLGHTNWFEFGLLGIVLSLGYLTKAAMFPISFVFLIVSLFSLGNLRRALPRVLVAFLVFLMISAPFIYAMSIAKGRLTFGDAGTLTYVRYVNGVPYPHWQGEPAISGSPEHPSRKIYENPPVYEFNTPIGGTYPIGYDPSYWYEGVVPQFDVGQQFTRLLSSVSFYLDLFLHQLGVLLASVLIMYYTGTHRRIMAADFIRGWGLFVIAITACGMYALVYVEGRYVGVFIVLLCADLLANLCLPESQVSQKLVSGLSVMMVLVMLTNIAAFNLKGLSALSRNSTSDQVTSQQAKPLSWPGEVAEELNRLGVKACDKVAVIGYGFGSFWARLARVQIVSEMLGWQADKFWLGDSTLQSEVIQVFSTTGVNAIIAENVPGYANLKSWHQVGNTNYFIYLVSR